MATLLIIEGSSPQYFFELSAYPDVTQYIWRKDGAVFTAPDDRVTLYANGIQVSNVTRADSGVYSVETTVGGGASATVIVIVYCELLLLCHTVHYHMFIMCMLVHVHVC